MTVVLTFVMPCVIKGSAAVKRSRMYVVQRVWCAKPQMPATSPENVFLILVNAASLSHSRGIRAMMAMPIHTMTVAQKVVVWEIFGNPRSSRHLEKGTAWIHEVTFFQGTMQMSWSARTVRNSAAMMCSAWRTATAIMFAASTEE
jgi:hypothetical protein